MGSAAGRCPWISAGHGQGRFDAPFRCPFFESFSRLRSSGMGCDLRRIVGTAEKALELFSESYWIDGQELWRGVCREFESELLLNPR